MNKIQAEIHFKRCAEVGMTNYNHEAYKRDFPAMYRVAIKAIRTAPK